MCLCFVDSSQTQRHCCMFWRAFYLRLKNKAQTISDERFSIGHSSEIPRISDRILIENRSSEMSDRKLPVSTSVRHVFFLPIGNNDSVRNVTSV